MRCKKCGSKLDKEERYCSACGAKAEKSWKTVIIISSAAVILLVVAVSILTIYPEYKYSAYLKLGDKYYGELKYNDAELSYIGALNIREKREVPYLRLADVYLAEDNMEQAENIIRTGIKNAGASDEFATYLDDIKKREDIQDESVSANQPSDQPIKSESLQIREDRDKELHEKTALGQLGLIDKKSLNYTIKDQSRNMMNGVISSYVFTQDNVEYEWMISMDSERTGNNKYILQVYNADSDYELAAEVIFSELFPFAGGFRKSEKSIIFADTNSHRKRLICGSEYVGWEGSGSEWQIFEFDGSTIQSVMHLEYYMETTYEDVYKGGSLIAQFQDGQPVEGDYGSAQEAVDKVLNQWGLDRLSFFSEDNKEDKVCRFSNSTNDLDFYGNCTYTGEIVDYTNLEKRVEKEDKEIAEQVKEQPLEMTKKVPDSEIEQEILNIRAIFDYDMEQTAAGIYQEIPMGNAMTVWLNSGRIAAIKTDAEDVTEDWEKIFSYSDGKVIFAFDKKNGSEQRCYYKDNSLIRWSYPNAESIHDNEYDNLDFVKYGQQYLQEGYELYQQAEKIISSKQ